MPGGIGLAEARELRERDPADYTRRSMASMAEHVRAMLAFQASGSVVFDYGNNIRAHAREAGVENAFDFPGFVPAFIRPLFCEGKGPFRWAALSGDPEDILKTDAALAELFPEDASLHRWLRLAEEKVPFQGLPARICWLGYGERARAGLRINEMVASGELSAPIVIGRDHLDAGSVASPYRETEGMRDGSDAIADWPILNALLNTAAGATWVSFHHGGGVGIGYSLHAGMVIVADGTPEAAARLERVLTTDPGMGVIRHADAGYERALEVARERGVRVPMGEPARSLLEIESVTDMNLERAAAVGRAYDADPELRPVRVGGDPARTKVEDSLEGLIRQTGLPISWLTQRVKTRQEFEGGEIVLRPGRGGYMAWNEPDGSRTFLLVPNKVDHGVLRSWADGEPGRLTASPSCSHACARRSTPATAPPRSFPVSARCRRRTWDWAASAG